MSIELTWLGHGTWKIQAGGKTILLDPFLDQSPTAPVKSTDVSADIILVSHGHFDHVADVASIANRCHSQVVAIYEIAEWFQNKQSVETTIGMNIGGTLALDLGEVQVSVKMTPALHSSQLPDGSPGGVAAGFLLTIAGKKIYFACDTGLFSDMQLIGAAGVDVAVLPIGDLFTMGIEDSIQATKLINPKIVLPTHYNTWPPIEADTDRWQQEIKTQTSATPSVIQPGESLMV